MHGHLCIMEFRKRGTPVASATSKLACCRMCARLQDHCDGSASSSRLLPARRRKKKTQSRQKLPLLPTSSEGAHKRPPMQGVLVAGRQNKAAGPTRSRNMPSTRDFPATSFASCSGCHSLSSGLIPSWCLFYYRLSSFFASFSSHPPPCPLPCQHRSSVEEE